MRQSPDAAPRYEGSWHANWTGLDPAKRWFGIIHYDGSDDVTFFSVG
jgi:hypothetical protein